MKSSLCAAALLVLSAILNIESKAQITAITTDGRKVLLNDDGTWKYVFETDGRKVILNPDGTWRYETPKDSAAVTSKSSSVSPGVVAAGGAAAVVTPAVSGSSAGGTLGVSAAALSDSTGNKPVDSVRNVVVVPPKPKPPLNLDCGYLVSVQKEISGDKYTAVSKNIVFSEDSKTGFTISFRKTKSSPLIWNTVVMGTGQCFDIENKMTLVFKDGARLQIPNDGKANCDGYFKLLFGGEGGKEEIFELLKKNEIAGIRLFTTKGYVEQQFSEDNALRFKAAIGCMPK